MTVNQNFYFPRKQVREIKRDISVIGGRAASINCPYDSLLLSGNRLTYFTKAYFPFGETLTPWKSFPSRIFRRV